MDPTVGLAIQCVGIILVTVLTFFMRASIRNAALNYWTIAWACLAVSLFSLFIGFHLIEATHVFYSVYFLGEYAFGLMFVAGCRHYSTGKSLSRRDGYFLLVALAVAIVLPFLSSDFNDLFTVQAIIMAILFGASVFSLRPALAGREISQGLRVMRMALVLLTIDFLHYLPVFSFRKGLWGIWVPAEYLQYTSIVDLIFEILLGFGTVMVLMEAVRREMEATNRKLRQAHDKLELLAQMDPLTEALNRHAFHSLLSRNESDAQSDVYGCVAVIDIDNLKTINDSFGHRAGDRAIRAAASGVRSLIRADDMLFRWGGDEFLVLMFKLEESEAFRRLLSLNDILSNNGVRVSGALTKLSVSFGTSTFASLGQLSTAIEDADKAMYERRQTARRSQLLELAG